jgi:hypothetical protein
MLKQHPDSAVASVPVLVPEQVSAKEDTPARSVAVKVRIRALEVFVKWWVPA